MDWWSELFKATRNIKCILGGSIDERLCRFLFWYRLTPYSTTGIPPAELLLGRQSRLKLDFLKPNLSDTVQSKTVRQKTQHDVGTKLRTFRVHDKVYVKDFPNSKQWKPGEIIEVRRPLSYLVELCDGRVVRRHVDTLLARMATDSTESTGTPLLDVPDPSLLASKSTTVPAVVETAPLWTTPRSFQLFPC